MTNFIAWVDEPHRMEPKSINGVLQIYTTMADARANCGALGTVAAVSNARIEELVKLFRLTAFIIEDVASDARQMCLGLE